MPNLTQDKLEEMLDEQVPSLFDDGCTLQLELATKHGDGRHWIPEGGDFFYARNISRFMDVDLPRGTAIGGENLRFHLLDDIEDHVVIILAESRDEDYASGIEYSHYVVSNVFSFPRGACLIDFFSGKHPFYDALSVQQ